MSRLISDILGAPEPHFSHAIKNWEHKSGQSGHDLRLISDISLRRQQAIKELQLDTNDTTPKELFYALRHKAAETNLTLEQQIGVTPDDSPDEVVQKIVSYVDTLPLQRDVWIMKHAVVKELLKKHSPKKLLKVLGLRSIDSVLKRTNSYEVLSLAYQIESPEWALKMHAYFKKLKPTDFQASPSSIYVVSPARVAKLHVGGYTSSKILLPNYETGTVLIVPPARRFPMDVLTITLSLLQTLYELRVYSAYFRLMSVKPDFGARLQQLMQKGLPGKLHETEIGWKVLQRHLTGSADTFERVEQPHFQYDDVELIHPLQTLSEAIPAFIFWNQQSQTFMSSDQMPVSLHLLDVSMNASNQVPFESAQRPYLQQQLWEELGLRYLSSPAIESAVMIELIGDDF